MPQGFQIRRDIAAERQNPLHRPRPPTDRGWTRSRWTANSPRVCRIIGHIHRSCTGGRAAVSGALAYKHDDQTIGQHLHSIPNAAEDGDDQAIDAATARTFTIQTRTSLSLPVATSKMKPRNDSCLVTNGLASMRRSDCRTSSSRSKNASAAHSGFRPVSS